MNKDNNQRFRDTEEKILNAYGRLANKKDLDKISVSDICREASIHRTTFYGHFLDIRDLRECAFRNQFQRLIESVERKDGPNYREMILQELLFCYRHQKILKRSFQSSGLESATFFPSLLDSAVTLSEEDSQNIDYAGRHWKSRKELEYYETYVQTGFLAILRRWILADCPETPEELCEIIFKIYQ